MPEYSRWVRVDNGDRQILYTGSKISSYVKLLPDNKPSDTYVYVDHLVLGSGSTAFLSFNGERILLNGCTHLCTNHN